MFGAGHVEGGAYRLGQFHALSVAGGVAVDLYLDCVGAGLSAFLRVGLKGDAPVGDIRQFCLVDDERENLLCAPDNLGVIQQDGADDGAGAQ